jgi:hypothetical protein
MAIAPDTLGHVDCAPYTWQLATKPSARWQGSVISPVATAKLGEAMSGEDDGLVAVL